MSETGEQRKTMLRIQTRLINTFHPLPNAIETSNGLNDTFLTKCDIMWRPDFSLSFIFMFSSCPISHPFPFCLLCRTLKFQHQWSQSQSQKSKNRFNFLSLPLYRPPLCAMFSDRSSTSSIDLVRLAQADDKAIEETFRLLGRKHGICT